MKDKIIAEAAKLLLTADTGTKECKIYNDGFLDGVEFAVNKALSIADVSGSFTKDEVINILQKRADNAFHKFHEHGRNEILQAIDIITRRMPPSSFPDW